MYLINEQEIFGKWAPIIESTTGIQERSRGEWMSKYCHYHELYENNNLAQLGAVNGMGATRFPGDPTTQAGFPGQEAGSGDKAHTLLPLAMQVAAQTIGLDLVPVVPMAGPMGLLSYLDFTYEGGTVALGATAPTYIKAALAHAGAVTIAADANNAEYEFIGASRIAFTSSLLSTFGKRFSLLGRCKLSSAMFLLKRFR